MHAPDQLQIGDRLTDLPVQCVLLSHDVLPDPVLRTDLECGDYDGEEQIKEHDPDHDTRCVEKNLNKRTHGGDHVAKTSPQMILMS